jgi:hypothetical protein
MDTHKSSKRSSLSALLWTLLVMVALAALCVIVGRPYLLQISDQAGPFYITFSPADMEGDGDMDVLVHNMRKPGRFEAYAGGTLWTNQGGVQGGVAGMLARRLNDIEGGWASRLADLDGDGDPDVLIYFGNRITLGINQGVELAGEMGIFKPVADIPTPTWNLGQYGMLLTGDIDGDGRVDALLLGRGHSYGWVDQPLPENVSWTWLNGLRANGLFTTGTANIEALKGLSVGGAALGDVDEDGDLDLLAAVSPSKEDSMSGSSMMVLLNDGKGSFSDSELRLPARESSSVALGDLDGDGDLDALVGTGGGAVIYTNAGPGDFKMAEPPFLGGKARSVHLADMDNDGDLDALVAGGRQARLWWNDGEGRFSKAEQRIPCSEWQDVTVADFSGDGRLDIFVGEYDRRAWVWVNEGEGRFREEEMDLDSD